MNWTLAFPEIVLAVLGMAILVFGVLRKQTNSFILCTNLVYGAFIVAGGLVFGVHEGVGYHGQFTVDSYATFAKLLVLAASGLSLIVSTDFNQKAGLDKFEFPVKAGAVRLFAVRVCAALARINVSSASPSGTWWPFVTPDGVLI